jgi:hypothetical protein
MLNPLGNANPYKLLRTKGLKALENQNTKLTLGAGYSVNWKPGFSSDFPKSVKGKVYWKVAEGLKWNELVNQEIKFYVPRKAKFVLSGLRVIAVLQDSPLFPPKTNQKKCLTEKRVH